jgi:hypothetical protein
MTTVMPDRNSFQRAYAGQPPWHIGRPNKALVDAADRITGSVLMSAARWRSWRHSRLAEVRQCIGYR